MKHLLFGIACAAACASLAVESGDKVLIEDQEYLIVHMDDWARLTNRVQTIADIAAERWQKLNATETGRLSAHGQRKRTTITNGVITVEYADGYTRTESFRSNATRRIPSPVVPQAASSSVGRAAGGDARPLASPVPGSWEDIQSRRRSALSTTNEVTITIGK